MSDLPDPPDADRQTIHDVLTTAEVGYLALVKPDGRPRVAPVDFVADGTTIYFHGATDGEKHAVMAPGADVCFQAALIYSVIPSHWLTAQNARGANHYFMSVQIDGRVNEVGEPGEKARALQLLMEKYQPEGQFLPITVDEPFYAKALPATAVFRVGAVTVSTRINMGLNRSERVRRMIIDRLEERGTPVDRRTAETMRRMLTDGEQGK